VRDARCAVDQRSEIAFRAGDCKLLERIAAGVHHRDDDRRQVLP
jgi:hypothetical protein